MLDHSSELGEPTQGHFAPPAANLGSPERRHQVAGLALQRSLPQRHAFYRTAQRAEALGTFLLDARDLFVRLLQRLPDRSKHALHGLFAVSEVAERELLLLAEHLTGDLQEELTVAAQRVARHRIEARSQPLERKVERLRPLAGDLFG